MQSLFFGGGGGATRTTTNGNTNNDTDAVAVPPLLLALGTLQWGTTLLDDRLINAPRGNLTENEAHEIWNEFVVKNKGGGGGVTIVDTAEGYGGGTSEKRLGRLSSNNNAIVVDGRSETTTNNNGSGGSEQEEDREIVRVLFMTKFLPTPWRHSHKCFERALRASNHRLNIECCPVYLLHSPVHWRPIEYWIEAAAMCKRKGLLKSVGMSNCNADQVRRAVEAGNKFGVPVVCNQVHYSLLDYNSPSLRDMEATCRDLNVTIVAYSPLGQGLLTDRELSSDNKVAKMLRLKWDDVAPLRSGLRRIADKHSSSSSDRQQPDQHQRKNTNATMAQVALNWCQHHGTIPLVGCRSKRQAVDSLQSLTWTLSDDEVAELDRLALDRSTLDSPPWRRAIFVSLASVVMVVCRALDRLLGYRGTVEKNASVEPERQAAAAAAKDKSQ